MVAHAYRIGETVEALDPAIRPSGWRKATVTQLAPFRGKPGYYIAWQEVPGAPDGIKPSSGGWMHERAMRHPEGGNWEGCTHLDCLPECAVKNHHCERFAKWQRENGN
jgi:hypothetical protein